MADRILVLDDDRESRNALARSLRALGLQTIVAEGPFHTLGALSGFAQNEGATHVITDQRLRERRYSSFLGAAAAAALYTLRIAPILMTKYARQDMDSDIRPDLGYIPRVVHRTRNPVDPVALQEALSVSSAEVRHGVIPRERKKFRSVVCVQKIVQRQPHGPRELRFLIRQWRKDVTVGFPENRLAADIQRAIKPGLLLLAQVNIEAKTDDALFLMDFELPQSEDTLDL